MEYVLSVSTQLRWVIEVPGEHRGPRGLEDMRCAHILNLAGKCLP